MSILLTELARILGEERLQFFSPHVWLYKGKNPFVIIKIEQIASRQKLFVNASFARDGSGPIIASFMSMLFIEEGHATAADTIGICSGHASVTLHHLLDITDMDHQRLETYLDNFEALALCVFGKLAGQSTYSSQIELPSHHIQAG